MKLRDRMDPKYTRISLYVIGTCATIYLLGYIIRNLPTVSSAIATAFSWCAGILQPVFWGFVLAYLLFPVNGLFEKLENKLHIFQRHPGKKRALSVAMTAILVVAVLVVLLSLIVSAFSRQLSVIDTESFMNLVNMATRSINSFYESAVKWLSQLNFESEEINDYVQHIGTDIAELITDWSQQVLGAFKNIPAFFSNLIFTIIFAVYFQLDHEGLRKYWGRAFRALFPKRFNHYLRICAADADRVCSGYIRGQFLDAILMAITVSVALSLVGVRFSVLIGIFTGIGNLIPYVGPIVGYCSTIIICLINGDYVRLLIGIIIVFVIQTVDGNIVNPKLLSSNIDVHPMLVILALIVGSSIGGIVGMLAAVPCAAFLKIQFERLVNYLIKKRHLEDPPETDAAASAESSAGAGSADQPDAGNKDRNQETIDPAAAQTVVVSEIKAEEKKEKMI